MAKFFLSYRRSDTGQLVGRMSEKLAAYFGRDAIYVDVDIAGLGQDFPEHIQKFISQSDALLVVIGRQWLDELRDRADHGGSEDYVSIEIALALRQAIPILPILIDGAPMPPPAGLPPAIAQLSFRNAFSLDAGRDFNADLNRLIQHLDSIRISKVLQNQQVGDYMLIRNCCQAVVRFLRREAETGDQFRDLWFHTYGTGDFYSPMAAGMSLFLYRIVPDSSSLAEIHLMLTTWGRRAEDQHLLAGWIIDRLQRNPVLPVDPDEHGFPPGVTLRIFPSTEDPRNVWSCVSQRPYELSLSYILRASY